MVNETLTIALISDVFYEDDAEQRLRKRLREAKATGAKLAVLPELPLNPWSPATKQQRDDDAEPPNGPRSQLQQRLAGEVGIGLIGGAVIRDPANGVRHNTALVIDAAGKLCGTYCKTHIPQEPGFWETSHYASGEADPHVFDCFDMPIGVQICSDINRTQGSHLLGAMGAAAVLAPRATELATWDRWKTVFRAHALTCCVYMLSANRPAPEQDVLIGGPSIAVDPNGQVLLETTEPVAAATLSSEVLAEARKAYPGYLPLYPQLYSRAWQAVADR